MTARWSAEQIADVKARAGDIVRLAETFGARLRRVGRVMAGTCPVCGGGKTTTRFEIKGPDQWVCAVCADGGDMIRLVQRCKGLDFVAAVEWLGGARALTDEEKAQAERARAAREAKERAARDAWRRREREAADRLWTSGRAPSADGVGRYLAARGVDLPASAVIRECASVPYWYGEEEDARGHLRPRLLARTPAMLARFFDASGHPVGLHITHLAPDWSDKARLSDPVTGEALNAKKMRGSKKGAHLVLREVAPGEPCRLFMAEGIETALSVATALRRCGEMRPTDRFWAAGDLGNLGGTAIGTVAHPTRKGPSGRPERVHSAVPDMSAPGIVIPACVTDLILLGDGDSEPVATRLAMERGRARYARPGLRIAVAMADEGGDFNDMIRGAA